MYATQKQVLESFVRVRAFLEAHPATGPLTYRGAREAFDEALHRIREHAGTQVSGRALARAELRRREQLVRRLRDHHMRPIVTVARAQIEPGSDVRLPVALRLPPGKLSVVRMLQACDGMIEAATPFASVLIENGLPADFLIRFRGMRDELERSVARRATLVGTHVGARKGLQEQLRRGRLAVDRLDAVVRVAFEGDEVVLATWRAAKRVHRMPGGRGVGGAGGAGDAGDAGPAWPAAERDGEMPGGESDAVSGAEERSVAWSGQGLARRRVA